MYSFSFDDAANARPTAGTSLSNGVRGTELDFGCLGGDIPPMPYGKWLRQRAKETVI